MEIKNYWNNVIFQNNVADDEMAAKLAWEILHNSL